MASTQITTAPTTAQRAEPPAEHQPYVPDQVQMPEFTWPAVLVGAVLGIIFGASSLYLVLKVGLTVSASIPVAVLSITLFRLFAKLPFIRRATILENNIVQTTGSAGESIAFGVGVTMPALMILGFEMEIGRVMVVAVLGGLLGILMMIPLRRAFIVKQHGTLKYPEGTACADVLIVGEQGGASAKTVFVGFGVAFLYQVLWAGMRLWKEVASKPLSWFKGATASVEVNPALLGVGYIIGPRISCVMVGGGMLAAFVLTPAIHLFGDPLTEPVYPATRLIKDMSDRDARDSYILYIGAGAVAAGGILSLFQALPLILGSVTASLRDLRRARSGEAGDGDTARTDQDLPLWVVGVGSLVLVGLIWLTSPLHQVFPWVPDLQMHLLGAVLIVVFGFLFVTVSSRITGEIGSSSNPISGMTVATLLLTCLIFYLLDWTDIPDSLTALSVAAVVCIAASNGGTTSQDLKTGYLVGATPRYQQLAILIGALSSALAIGWILVILNEGPTVYSKIDLPKLKTPVDVTGLPRATAPDDSTPYPVWFAREGNPEGIPPGKYLLDEHGKSIKYLVDPGINGRRSRRDDGTEVRRYYAPKAQLMALITNGILQQKLPWTLVLLGVSIALVLELCGVSSLAFAVGVYLPLSASTPIFAGGLVRYVADRWGRYRVSEGHGEAEAEFSPGVLMATGYIAGGAIAGVLIGFLAFSDAAFQALGTWEHRRHVVEHNPSYEDLAKELARKELGLGGTQELSEEEDREVKDLVQEIRELNSNLNYQYALVPKGTVLRLPQGETYKVPQKGYLRDIAEQVLGSDDKAQLLFADNEDQLREADRLPAGTTLKLPQRTAPALIAFAILIVILLLVGLGWLLQAPPLTPASIPPTDSTHMRSGPST